MNRLSDYVVAAAAVYEACHVQPGEKVTIYSDTGRETEVVDAFIAAAQLRGADTTTLRVPARKPLEEPPTPAVEAMKESDFVVDLASESWLYTPATTRILRGGTRMLQVLMPSENILRKNPRPEIAARAAFAESLFDGETTVRIVSSDAGELRASFKGRAPAAQDGVVVGDGEWDSLGTAFVNVCPVEGSAEGTVTLNSTVYLAGASSFIVETPIRLTIRDGQIKEVRGGVEAERLQAWLDSYRDPNLGMVAHLGFGFDERSGPPPKSETERDWVSWEAMHGGVIVAFGANTIDVEFRRGKGAVGGKNKAPSHADSTVLGADFYVGRTKVLQGGVFQFKELMPEA